MSIILIKPINFYRLIDFFCPSLLNLNISIILKFLKSGADHLLEYTIRFIVFVVKLFGKLFAKVGALIDFILRCLNVVIEPLFESVVHYFDYTIKYFGKILTKLVDFIYKYLVEITDYVFELVIFIVKAILKFFFKLFTGFNWSAVSHLTFDYVKDYIIN